MTFGKCKGPSGEYWDCYLNYYSRCTFCCLYCWYCNWRRTGPVLVTDRPENLPGYIEKYDPKEIILCNTTDAYQPAEKRLEATRHVLDWWLDNICDMPLCILTKSPLVERDIDLLSCLKARIGFTISTMDPILANTWEPLAPPPGERILALEALHDGGFETWVSCEPCLDEETPFKLLELDVDRVYVGGLTKRWFIHPEMKGSEPKIDYRALGERLLDLGDDRVVLKKSMRVGERDR